MPGFRVTTMGDKLILDIKFNIQSSVIGGKSRDVGEKACRSIYFAFTIEALKNVMRDVIMLVILVLKLAALQLF